jgi:hypothetical protein
VESGKIEVRVSRDIGIGVGKKMRAYRSIVGFLVSAMCCRFREAGLSFFPFFVSSKSRRTSTVSEAEE